MATLKIRIELHRPAKGVEMSKLAELAAESQKFLRMVAEDAGVDPNAGTWVAEDFYNQGVGFDAEYQLADVDAEQVASYINALEGIAAAQRETNWSVKGVRPLTVLQSAKLATVAESGEAIRIGLHPANADASERVDWRVLPRDRGTAIVDYFQESVEYRGMLQGLIHAIYKESNPPHFAFRDFASGALVNCEFTSGIWNDLHRALERKDAVVLVSGWIRAKRIDRSIDVMRVEKIRKHQALWR